MERKYRARAKEMAERITSGIYTVPADRDQAEILVNAIHRAMKAGRVSEIRFSLSDGIERSFRYDPDSLYLKFDSPKGEFEYHIGDVESYIGRKLRGREMEVK